MQDVAEFLRNDSIHSISIVTNQGKVWTLSKGDTYDRTKAFKMLSELANNSNDWDKNIDIFIRNRYSYGVERG